ncbi:MAG: SDR family oxidoreductase [Salinisphaera sp.]|nr:SDR family oxidoreductase [Salinisphaera sp.]
MPQTDSQTILITGASSGVGAATARRFAALGAHVVLAARGAQALQAVADEIGGTAITADVASNADCLRLIQTCVETSGRLDVLVNNAGCHHRGPLASVDTDALAQMVDTNLRAPVVLSRAALPHLQAAPRGAIVNVASIAGQMPLAGSAVYSATKFGLRALTYALAEELRGSSVSVSVVSPGPIETDFILDNIDNVSDITFSQPMSTPEQIAELIVACAADGRIERSRPRISRVIATAGYLIPALPRLLRPALERRGRRAKDRYRGS